MDSISSISSISNSQSTSYTQGSTRPVGFKRLMDASAEYLGMSADDLRSQIQAGKSLADIAKAEGKSVEGLKQALQAALPAPPTQSPDGASAMSSAQGVDSSSFLDQIINGYPGKHHHGAVQSSTSTDDSFTSNSVNLLV